VTGVGQESPLLLQRVTLRCLGSPDSIEHVVQGESEPADLIGDRRDRQRRAFRISKIISADRGRALPQVLDRTQGQARHPITDTAGGQQSGGKSDNLHTQRGSQRLGSLVEGVGDHHDVFFVPGIHRHGEDPERLVETRVARTVHDQLIAGGGLQLRRCEELDIGVGASGHDVAIRGEDLGECFVGFQRISSCCGQRRYRLPHEQPAKLRGTRAEVALDVTVQVRAELDMQVHGDRGEHHRERERERQGESPADGQPVHSVSSVRSR